MEPFIVDPNGYDKELELRRAIGYVEGFLSLNGLPTVDEYLFAPDLARNPPGRNPWHDKGWYWFGTLFVNLRRSKVPVKVPGFSWSYTGYKADLTAPGILAHEVGHHVHLELDRRGDVDVRRGLLALIRAVAATEAPVSGYEPNEHEVMAEAMRLFIMNPSLLLEGRPKRFAMLVGLGLQPPHHAPWRDVLRNAHPRFISAAENWIRRAGSLFERKA